MPLPTATAGASFQRRGREERERDSHQVVRLGVRRSLQVTPTVLDQCMSHAALAFTIDLLRTRLQQC